MRAVVVDDGLRGLRSAYADLGPFCPRFVDTEGPLDLMGSDLVIVPNGSDHVALAATGCAIRHHLDRGGGLVCADGWFTDWVPNHRWVHCNRYPTREVRYRVRSDHHRLLAGLDLDEIIFHHGISGWWACGYIDADPRAEVLLEDSWGRPVLVLDEVTTPGRMLLSASGPLAEVAVHLPERHALVRLWRRVLAYFGAHLRPRMAESSEPPSESREPFSDPVPSGARIGLLFNGVWSQHAFALAPKYRPHYRRLYVHDVTEGDLEALDAVVVPFQTHRAALRAFSPALERFCQRGGTVVAFGDSEIPFGEATWEDRPINNFWWKTDPTRPPVEHTDRTHSLYGRLEPRHAGWHNHGVFTRVPPDARVVQQNRAGEIVTWERRIGAGRLLATTKDPIVEHGVQQIRHLDAYCDALTFWLVGRQPEGAFTVDEVRAG